MLTSILKTSLNLNGTYIAVDNNNRSMHFLHPLVIVTLAWKSAQTVETPVRAAVMSLFVAHFLGIYTSVQFNV